MIEVIGRIVRHAEFLHHPARPHIGRDREAYELVQSQNVAGIPQDRQGSFGCQAPSPHAR